MLDGCYITKVLISDDSVFQMTGVIAIEISNCSPSLKLCIVVAIFF